MQILGVQVYLAKKIGGTTLAHKKLTRQTTKLREYAQK